MLSCTDIPDMACDALTRALAARLGQAPGRRDGPAPHSPGQITVTLDLLRQEKTFIEGRLRWSLGGAPATIGPVLEISVMDANVSAATYDRLAEGLLRSSDLPF